MTAGERFIKILKGEKASPLPWAEHGISGEMAEAVFDVKLPSLPPGEPDIDFYLAAQERHKITCELMGSGCIGLPRHYSMAPRVRNADNSGILTDEKSLEKLIFVELTEKHWDDVKRLVDAKGDYALFAPISLGIGHVWQTMDLMAFSVAIIDNPALLHEILRRYTEWTSAVIEKINAIGVDCVWTYDDFAFKTGTVYSPDFFTGTVLPYARTVADAINLPWVFHSDGNYMSVLDDLLSLGMNAINPVEPGCLDIPEIRRRFPDLVLIGNVEVDVLGRGTEEETRMDVDRAFRELGETGPFLPSSSNSIPEYCLPANVRAMFERYREIVGSG